MASSGMLRFVALVRTDDHPDEGGAKFFGYSVLTRATRRNIPEDVIFHGVKVFLQTQSQNFMDNVCNDLRTLLFFFHMQLTCDIIGYN
jgi:hypothetical protein